MFTQRDGVDYNEIFSLVAKYTWLRILFVSHFDWKLDQFDVKTAFFKWWPRWRYTYLSQLKGFELKLKSRKFCLLKKSIYGLKEVLRKCYKKFNSCIQTLSIIKSNFDYCFFYNCYGRLESIYLLFYVDDMLLACHDRAEIDLIKSKLKSKFDMKELGQAKKNWRHKN